MTTRIKLRRDTAANWEDINPVLALGEAGYDTTNNALRIGDGTTAWTGLVTLTGENVVGRYTSTVNDSPTDATVISKTNTKVFLSPGSGIYASYVLEGDGLYDGQTIEFYPQWVTGTNNTDVQNIFIWMKNMFQPDSTDSGKYYNGNDNYYPWYPFQNFSTGGAKGTATWNATQGNWVINPGYGYFD